MGGHRFSEGVRKRLYVSCASRVDCLAVPWLGRGRTEASFAVGGDITADDTGTLEVRCMNESENGNNRSTGLDRACWEGDGNQDIETLVEEGTRKRDRTRGIDPVHSSSLICRGVEGETAHNEAAHRQGTRVTLIVRGVLRRRME